MSVTEALGEKKSSTNETLGEEKNIPNVYYGTECGIIRQADPSLIGRRVVYEEYFGTVCYVGELPKSTGIWLGIDWDNESRGRHDGSYNGIRYFRTQSETSGSFVRPSKVSLGTSFEEAIVYRYAVCAECQLAAQSIDISSAGTTKTQQTKNTDTFFQPTNQPGKLNAYFGDTCHEGEAEYSGFDVEFMKPLRIELFTTPAISTTSNNAHTLCGASGAKKALSRLKIVNLSLVPVYRTLHGCNEFSAKDAPEKCFLWPSTGGCLGEYLTSIIELELSKCLISKWVEVCEICIQIPWLKVLNVSNNRIRLPLSCQDSTQPSTEYTEFEKRLLFDLDSDPILSEQLCSKSFPQLCQLALVRCSILTWKDVTRIMCWMPCLKSLAVAYNDLGNLPSGFEEKIIKAFQNLIELDLTSIGLSDVEQLFSIIGPSKYLDTLYLNNNQLTSLPNLNNSTEANLQSAQSFPSSLWFTNLSNLGLKNNKFCSWDFVHELMYLSKLNHLMVTECPLFENLTNETVRQEIIARLPKLQTLDRIEITPQERWGAELDYLKRYGAEWIATCPDLNENVTPDMLKRQSEFISKHPVFSRLCDKYGAPEAGETKLITCSIKENLLNLQIYLETDPNHIITKQIPNRMTINHLRMMIRRLFRLSTKTQFNLYIRSKHYSTISNTNQLLLLDMDTREIGFYNLENGDKICVQILK